MVCPRSRVPSGPSPRTLISALEESVSNTVSSYNIAAIKEAGNPIVCILELQVTDPKGGFPFIVIINFYDRHVPNKFGTINENFITVSLSEKHLDHYTKVLNSGVAVIAD